MTDNSLGILWNRSPGLNVAQDWLSSGHYLDIKAENKVFGMSRLTVKTTLRQSAGNILRLV